jgi:hypothetical protein
MIRVDGIDLRIRKRSGCKSTDHQCACQRVVSNHLTLLLPVMMLTNWDREA